MFRLPWRKRVRTPARFARRHFFRPTFEVLEDRNLLSNPVVMENLLTGTPESVWAVQGVGDPTLQGYSTDISVNHGQTISFKITDTQLAPYHIDIYRVGYYGGDGARLVASIASSQVLVQNQPAPLTNSTTGLIDCGNWSVSASWAVPSTAVSGVYFARVVRNDNGNGSLILFIVRADESHSDILFQTSDETWQAYNTYGGNSLYGPNGNVDARAFAVSYNRPLNDRGIGGGLGDDNSFFYGEFPMVEWLERNGYDVSYFTDVDSARNGSLIPNHKVFMDVGHDEYWTASQFNNVKAARDAGVNLAFFSGNEAYWKTEFGNSGDGSNTPWRTVICYKDSFANALINPDGVWTGQWADARFSPPGDGGIPPNSLSGTMFTVNRGPNDTGTPLTLASGYSNLRFWRNTAVAKLMPGQSISLGDLVLGYEWDSDLNNGARPAGLFDLSATTQNVTQQVFGFVDNDTAAVQPGTDTNSQTLYRASSGALVFGAGTVQWAWGLFGGHDDPDSAGILDDTATTPDINMEQATVNLLADMHALAGSLDTADGLVAASASTDTTAPTSTITSIGNGAKLRSGTPVLITGTASDTHGGVIASVEISTDGGQTWNRANGTATAVDNWSYQWTPSTVGQVTIMSRAVNDSGYIESPTDNVAVNVFLPTNSVSIWASNTTPLVPSATDNSPIELGVKFQTLVNGQITGIRFYKGPANTGTHVGYLYTSTGALLASATFTNETTSGWQQVNFSSPVAVTAGTTYVAAYYAPNGGYADDNGYFAFTGTVSGPLVTLADNAASGGEGLFTYGVGGAFPASTYNSSNYWVDVVLYTPPETVPPTVTTETPSSGAAGVPIGTLVKATFNDQVLPNTITFTLLQGTSSISATLTYDSASNTAILTPTSALAGSTTYTATLSGATDLSGNTMPGSVSWSFTTGSATAAPIVVSTNPSAGASNVSIGSTISAVFNEQIQPGTISFIVRDAKNNVVPGALTYKANNLTVTFTPNGPLNSLAAYTASVSGATDIGGNVMAAPASWGFQTAPAQYTLWNATSVPAVGSANDTLSIELGVKFETTVAGTISGIRFYKGSANTGTHVAHLWDASGNLLVSATFANESAVGWQQVSFPIPVAIEPNTVYIASYYAPKGGYAYNSSFFANSGLTVGPLQALSNAAANGNGVFLYASAGSFPTTSANGTNYWIDPVFNAIPDTDPPTVVRQTPLPNSTSTANNPGTVTVTFGELVQPTTIKFVLTDTSNNVVSSTLSYSTSTNTATLSPLTPLAGLTTYTATVSGATDPSGNVMSGSVSWSFTTGAATYTLWNVSVAPAVASANDVNSIELGVKIETTTAGVIDGIRFYKGSLNTGTHVAHLWDSNGNLLGTATFTNETSSGWQEVDFATPVAIDPNTVYVASYYAPMGGYAYSYNYFTSSGVMVGPLQALSNAAAGGNGVYFYGSGSGFPTNSYIATNYWVDAVFDPVPDTTPPTVVNQTPLPNSTNVANNPGTVTATFSEPVQSSTITFVLKDPNNNVVPVLVAYSSQTNTATMTPTVPLVGFTTYTATVSGATDLSGNVMTGSVSWSFTTQTVSYSLWTNAATPAVASANDLGAVELGVKIRTDFAGTISGVRFYKGAANTGTHLAHLWDASGNLLATATFTNETATGWQQINFSSPVSVLPNTTYVVSYFAPNGGYAYNSSYFATSGANSGPLHALASGVDGSNGVYLYGSSGGFPTNSYNNLNYWVDAVFNSVYKGAWTQTSTADFNGGTNTNTMVTSAGGGAVQEAQPAVLVDDFTGASLSANWTASSWTSQGGGATNVAVANSILSIRAAQVLSTQTYSTEALEESAALASTPYQIFGWSTGFASLGGNYWAAFGTAGTSNALFARVNSNGNYQDVSLGGLPIGFHDYKIVPVSTGFQFYVDSVLQTTIAITFPSGTQVSIAFSDFVGQSALQADWVKVYPYASSATFVSSVFDAGSTVTWGQASWTASTPAGTGITIMTRTSVDGVNWSSWTAVANAGTVASPAGRYIQYEALFTTTNPLLTATLFDITFNWS